MNKSKLKKEILKRIKEVKADKFIPHGHPDCPPNALADEFNALCEKYIKPTRGKLPEVKPFVFVIDPKEAALVIEIIEFYIDYVRDEAQTPIYTLRDKLEIQHSNQKRAAEYLATTAAKPPDDIEHTMGRGKPNGYSIFITKPSNIVTVAHGLGVLYPEISFSNIHGLKCAPEYISEPKSVGTTQIRFKSKTDFIGTIIFTIGKDPNVCKSN